MTTTESVHVEHAGRADLDEIHDLRLRAHRHDGRLTDVTAADLTSAYDLDARHLVVRDAGSIVAYMRVVDRLRSSRSSRCSSAGRTCTTRAAHGWCTHTPKSSGSAPASSSPTCAPTSSAPSGRCGER